MVARGFKILLLLVLPIGLFTPPNLHGQIMGGSLPSSGQQNGSLTHMREPLASLEILLKSPNGQFLIPPAVVTVTKINGQILRQEVARGGHVRIDSVPPAEYDLKIAAPGFSTTTQKIQIINTAPVKMTFQLEPASEGVDALTEKEMAELGSKGQKILAKAIEALRTKKFLEAREALDKAYKMAPQSAQVQYLNGIYDELQNENEKAKACWTKALELSPQHYLSLISMSEALLRENHASDAIAYLDRAEKIEPTAWRPHALYAEAYLKQGMNEKAIQQALRAQELGHGNAAIVVPILVAAQRGQSQKKPDDTPLDANAAQPQPNNATAATSKTPAGWTDLVIEMPSAKTSPAEVLPSAWMPPDIDAKMGAVEPGATCSVDEVLQKAADRVKEFLQNVDRFTATESLQHESIDKWGARGLQINRKFDYVVGIQELRPGQFAVDEFRSSANHYSEFADGVATNGLPAMILILHPNNAVNFEMTCEGLVRRSDGPAWQIHFRQRTDKPNTIRAYRDGLSGPVYPINLKGRVWISAETYQVLRLEAQMIAPVREIDLKADFTAIEYGPVHFNSKNLDMWLPQTAEAYSFWRGRRFHQSHTFSNYVLFSIEDQQKISDPKKKTETAPAPAPEEPAAKQASSSGQ